MFFDWNSNGQTNDDFDNFMDFMMISHMAEEDQKRRENNSTGSGSNGGYSNGSSSSSGSGQGCCGTCLLYMILVPAGVIGLIYGISRLLA